MDYVVSIVPLDSATLLYTYISRFPVNPHYQQQLHLRPFFIAFFSLSHKWPTFAFAGESRYTPGSAQRIAHSGSHAETGAFPPSATVRLVLPVKLPPKEQPEKVDTRLWRVSASSGTAAPLGCENSIT